MKKILKNLKKDSIYGFILGDCFGIPYEFSNRNSIKSLKMVGGLSHNQNAGTYSDDTAFILATLNTEKLDNLKIEFLKVLKGEYSINNNLFDVGFSTKNTLLGKKVDIKDGNGALMRCLPFAFIKINDNDLIKYLELTHKSNISNDCCIIYLEVVKKALLGNFNFLKNAQSYNNFYDLKNLKNVTTNGYVYDSLKIVLNIADNAESYSDGIIKAINLGGDTDTHSALIGALLALKFKDFNKFKKEIVNKDFIEKIIDKSIFLN